VGAGSRRRRAAFRTPARGETRLRGFKRPGSQGQIAPFRPQPGRYGQAGHVARPAPRRGQKSAGAAAFRPWRHLLRHRRHPLGCGHHRHGRARRGPQGHPGGQSRYCRGGTQKDGPHHGHGPARRRPT